MNKSPHDLVQIREQWDAGAVLLAGIIQRLEGTDFKIVQLALRQVSPGALVQVEYMMIYSAMQDVSRAGVPFTYDAILDAVRSLEPDKCFGFACIVLQQLWEKRAVRSVGDDDFMKAVGRLSSKTVRAAGSETRQTAPEKRAWWKLWK